MKKAKFNFEEPDLSRWHILTYDELLKVNGGNGSDSEDSDDETVESESEETSDEGVESATESTTGEEGAGESSADPTSESTSSGTNSESESGGHEIENTVEAVANAEVGDTLTRDDGTQVTITQGDIDWAQEHCDSYGKGNSEEAENKEGDLTTKEDEENSDSSLENESNSANSNSTANNTAEEKSEQGTANSTKESEVETTASGNKTSSTESSQPVESGHSEKSGHSFFDTIAEIFNSAKDWVSDLLGIEGNSKSAGNTVVEPEEPRYFNQRDFSDKFGANFGNHACAATSLLNEVSEQYTANTGKQMTETQAMNAMQSAVDAGSVSKSDAYVTNWQDAANDMAQSVGLSGTYTYTTNSASASATIYAIETNSTPGTDHFVNSNGAGTYYDPWNGTTGNVTDLNLTTTGLGGTRDLLYQ